MRRLITLVWPLTQTSPATELILEPRIRALSLAAFLVALLLRRIKLDLLAPARVVIGQRHVPQTAAVAANLRAATGSVHQIIIGNTVGRHCRRRWPASPRRGVVRSDARMMAVVFTTPKGFIDYVDFRTAPQGRRIDYRSRSSFGVFDFGKNCPRMREFSARFKQHSAR